MEMFFIAGQEAIDTTEYQKYIDRVVKKINLKEAVIADNTKQIKLLQDEISHQVELIRNQIEVGLGFSDPLLNWLYLISSPAHHQQFEALTAYWRGLEQKFRDCQGQLVLITHERLTGGEITKHYLSGSLAGRNMLGLMPPPQPYYYLAGFDLGIIEGEMSFDFARAQCFLPTNGYFKIETPEKPLFVEGRLPLPQVLFVGRSSELSVSGLLPSLELMRLFPVQIDRDKQRYQFAVGDEDISKLTLDDGLRFTVKARDKFAEAEKILRAKKAARESQKQ